MTYNEFIQDIIDTRGQWNIPDGEYWEGHHILPKSMGGEGQSYQKHPNIIRLYAREHFIAHRLLVEENPSNKKYMKAFNGMAFLFGRYDIELTPEEYEEARVLFSKSLSGENNPMYGKSLYDGKSKEELQQIHDKQSAARLKYYEEHPQFNKGKNNGMYDYQYSQEQMNRMFNGANNPFYGKHHSNEHKEKMRQSAKECVYFTNGVSEVRCRPENAPEGFYRGKLKRQWFNNTIKEIQVIDGHEIPIGYTKGRLKRKDKSND